MTETAGPSVTEAATPLPVPKYSQGRRPAGLQARGRARLNAFRTLVLLALGLFFLLPIAALVEFSTRGTGLSAPRTLEYWREIGSTDGLIPAILTSLQLAVLTSIAALVLLVPTVVWVRLKLPRLTRIVEFLCLLPLTIPAIALVVGLQRVYLWVTYYFGGSSLTLAFAYVVLVLPYVYRALDTGLAAIDLRTLSEAARSLGASWGTVMWRIVVPNITSALLNAALLSVALVLGEFTIANLLNLPNLQTRLYELGQANAGVAVAVAAAALLFAFVLLLVLSFVGGRRRQSAPAEEEET
jgi:putative spermidine/putrescine transport system permease protein